MTFRTITDRIKAKVRVRSLDVFTNVVSHAHQSIQVGSEVTGSRGQPVDHGDLRASYHVTFESPKRALIATHSKYARQNEDGIARPGGGPYRQRSPVGGRWSIALTIAGLPRIVAVETAKVAHG